MKLVALVWLQLCFVSSVRGQAPGATCGANSACTSPAVCDVDGKCKNAINADCTAGATAYCPVNAKCAGTDGTTGGTSCECVRPFIQKGNSCVPLAGQPCGKGQCLDRAVCTSGACTCESGFEGAAGAGSCSCPSTHILQGGVCRKKIGQTCSAASECVTGDGVICDTTCKCDTTKAFAVGTAGDNRCSCDTTKAQATVVGGRCPLKAGQACTANSDCVSTVGMLCDSGTHQCACDTTNKFAAATAGDITCACATNYALRADRTCGLVIGQPCTAVAQCIDDTVCADDGGANKCLCDTSKHFAVGTTSDKSCVCATNYDKKDDGSCGLVIGQTCTAVAQCIDDTVCANDGGTVKCLCDTSKNFAVGTAGDKSCSCDTTKAAGTAVDGYCLLKVDQTCSVTSNCINTAGMVCASVSGTNKCTCDTTKNFAAGTAGASTCSCDTTKAAAPPDSNGYCRLKVGQTCSATSNCIDTVGMVCASVSGTNKCTCDTTKQFAAGTAGDSSCSCATNHALKDDGTCGLKIGQTCTANGTACIDGAVCDELTVTCLCDTGNGYAAGSPGASSCSCDSSTHVTTSVGCGKKVGGFCDATCLSYASCNATSGMCACDAGTRLSETTSTCSGTSALVSSLAVLAAGTLMALRKV